MFGLGIGTGELLLAAIIAVLLFGKRLPEVARSFGKSYNQFRDGLSELQREINQVSDTVTSSINEPVTKALPYEPEDYDEPTAPKFEPPEDE